MSRYKLIIYAFAVLVCSGCGVKVVTEEAPIVLPEFITATLPPTTVLLPTPTSPPPTPAPTLPPVEGTTNTQVNVRAETNTASESFGVIPPFTKVQITGKESTGTWYQILYADSPTGTGWVRAEYIQAAKAEIQVRELEAGFGSGVDALVVSGINVRSGPGTEYESLGVLIPKDVVLATGRDASGAWVQIRFSKSPDGTGWAAVEFLQVEDLESLPVVGEPAEAAEATPAMTESAGALPTAPADGDSTDAPLARGELSPAGSRAMQVQGEVSAPEGDHEDWIAFSSSTAGVSIQVSCEADALRVELHQAGSVTESFILPCGSGRALKIQPNEVYTLRLSAAAADEPQFIAYQLKIEASL
ncbi:MAG: SH3 domain-containing protein [Chloroflexi bacterium]|nr:SH3 domain-containing protein [Chloroflexota bacterium]